MYVYVIMPHIALIYCRSSERWESISLFVPQSRIHLSKKSEMSLLPLNIGIFISHIECYCVNERT